MLNERKSSGYVLESLFPGLSRDKFKDDSSSSSSSSSSNGGKPWSKKTFPPRPTTTTSTTPTTFADSSITSGSDLTTTTISPTDNISNALSGSGGDGTSTSSNVAGLQTVNATTTPSPSSSTSSASSTTNSTTSSIASPVTPQSFPLSSLSVQNETQPPIPFTSSTASADVQAAALHRANNIGAIAGGVVGGVIFLLLLVLGALWFIRRRRRLRLPASAEFRDYSDEPTALGSYSIPHGQAAHMALQPDVEQGQRADAGGNDEQPPPFSPGEYTDPLFEKLRQTRQANKELGLAS